MFTLRFDMRAPHTGAPKAELYRAGIDMCAWADARGGQAVILSEHHATEDGHLPSPLILASAIASRTARISILLAAVVLPLYEPVRLAEEMSVLDIISRGRVSYVFGIGHRAEEYRHFGSDFHQRGRLADEKLALLLKLLGGEPVTQGSQRMHVTPSPFTPRGPRIMIAGGSEAAAERAARFGLGFLAQAHPPGLRSFYEAQCRAHGHPPGPSQFPTPGAATTVFVAQDVDQAWDELGPYLLHDARTAASYRHGDESVASISRASSVDELRRSPGAYRIYSVAEATSRLLEKKSLPLLPLCGGLPPDLAWPYLERAALLSIQVKQQFEG